MELVDPKAVDLIETKPQVGDLNICGACGQVNVIGVAGTSPLTEEELAELSLDEQRDLRFAVRAAKVNYRN